MAAVGQSRMADFLAWVLAIVLIVSGLFAQSGRAAEPVAPRTDLYGDPLPPGAVARIGTIRFQHEGAVTCLAFSPNMEFLASGSSDNTCRVWQLSSGKAVVTLDHPADVTALAYSPDGRFIATSYLVLQR